jgi:peptidoglycan/LPS O-acetylase OafA/YrhL
MRGAAAIAVVILHDPGFLLPLRMPSAYLAVDFFFMLSGFVISHAYSSRFADGLPWRQFMRDRVVRLYPLYILGVVIGLLSGAAAIGLGGGTVESLGGLLLASITGLLFLPSPTMHETPVLFPLNNPGWSLFFELLVNAVYALLWPWLTTRRLVGITGLLALALGGTALWFGDLDLGSAWPHFVGGFARVSFSFFAGVLLHRLRSHLVTVSPLALLLPVILCGLLMADLQPGLRVVFDLFCALLVFPVLIHFASRMEPGRRLIPACVALGAVSYPLYAIHFPVQELLRRIVRTAGIDPADLAPWAGIPILLLMVGACFLLVQAYDRPLQAHWRRRKVLA